MGSRCWMVLALAAAVAAQQPARVRVVPRILTQPPLSPAEEAELEGAVAARPGDVAARLRLLVHYSESAPMPPHDSPGRRAARLAHILYLIEHSPESLDGASSAAYVYRSGGAYADEADHRAAREAWLRQADLHPDNPRIVLNAARFLFVEDRAEALELLQRALSRSPGNHRLGANLGFFQAMRILRLDSLGADVAAASSAEERAADAGSAAAELDACTVPAVLAGAATALPNLALRASRGAPVGREVFELASRLMARARALAPGDPALAGPMPMIEYLQEAGAARARQGVAASSPPAPARIRIGASAAARKLIHRVQPAYPEEARTYGIRGEVRFAAVIARDGSVAALTALEGHPVLLGAAEPAVRQWRYEPILLNGSPVEVATEIVLTLP